MVVLLCGCFNGGCFNGGCFVGECGGAVRSELTGQCWIRDDTAGQASRGTRPIRLAKPPRLTVTPVATEAACPASQSTLETQCSHINIFSMGMTRTALAPASRSSSM